ncbi:MAG: hypothetical protein ABIE68_03545 [bacterium]
MSSHPFGPPGPFDKVTADPFNKLKPDNPHDPWGAHVDCVTTLPEIGGAQKLRIGPSGNILSEEFMVGKKKFTID